MPGLSLKDEEMQGLSHKDEAMQGLSLKDEAMQGLSLYMATSLMTKPKWPHLSMTNFEQARKLLQFYYS